ncbi:YpbS family protein [Cytobacillus sp. FJAT-54145]|uniref:YpbS family protein n=1 Tax=Cytobacillus spartinae TaxID=3299023 RepID=A0ABW6K8X7_9BACI
MSVHKAISQHVGNQNETITQFISLDEKREYFIEEAVTLCKQGSPFTTDKINEVTKRMNELSKRGKVATLPTRKLVTPDMVKEYVSRLK